MQTKNKIKKGKPGRIARKSGKTNRQRIERKSQPAGRGSLFKEKATSSTGPVTPFTIKPIDKKYTGLQVKVLQGGDGKYSDPEEQLKMIEDLYPLLSKLKGWKDPNINPNLDPGHILHCLLQTFDEISEMESWSINKSDEKYMIEGVKEWGSVDPIWIPIEFLSKFHQVDKELHELIIYAFMLVNKVNGISLFDDWIKSSEQQGYHGMIYEYLIETEERWEGDAEGQASFEQTLEYYGPKGMPTQYIKFMHGHASLKIFKKTLQGMRFNTSYRIAAEQCLKAALELVQTKMDIDDVCYNPYGEGITPQQYYQIIWTFDEDDFMWQTFSEMIDSEYNNLGARPFTWKQDLKEDADPEKIKFCQLIVKFFEEANTMANWMQDQLKHIDESLPELFNKKKQNKNVYLINSIV